MKKSMIALGVFGALAATAGSVAAQTAVNIYGILDAGFATERGGPGGTVNRLSSGIQSGSRLGFKGTEDLGGGLSAKFLLESGFGIDTGAMGQANASAPNGLLFGRQAYVGVASNWGEVDLGRQYTPRYLVLNQIDPFGAGLAGNSTNLISTVTRMNNTIKYTAPSWSGFTGELAYGFGEVAGDNTANRQIGASIGYENGPILAKLAYHGIDNATASDRAKNTLLGAKYDFGMAAASLGVNWSKGFATVDSRDYLLGVSVPFGPGTFLASYIRKDDRSALNADANQWALGYTHNLSKRTNLYTSFARITNDNGAAFTVGDATNAGSGNRAFNVGIRHKF